MKVIYSTQYFPEIKFFADLYYAEQFVIEKHENYQKQTLRSRANILSDKGVNALSIPVNKGRSKNKIKIDKVEIITDASWVGLHLKTLKTCYGKAPFFEHYFEELETLFNEIKVKGNLFEFNLLIIEWCISKLGIKNKIEFTEEFNRSYDGFTDHRWRKFTPSVVDQSNAPYWQLFGKNHVLNLSILDLLMIEGSSSKDIFEFYLPS